MSNKHSRIIGPFRYQHCKYIAKALDEKLVKYLTTQPCGFDDERQFCKTDVTFHIVSDMTIFFASRTLILSVNKIAPVFSNNFHSFIHTILRYLPLSAVGRNLLFWCLDDIVYQTKPVLEFFLYSIFKIIFKPIHC